MSIESNYTICRICGVRKERIYIGRYGNKKDKKYVGPEGKQWNGLKCPECVVLLAKEHMRRKRATND